MHLQKMLWWRNDERVYKWCRQREPLTQEQHLSWFKSLHGNDKIKMYAIELMDENGSENLVGVCGLTDIDWINRRAEFSLYIGPEYWKKGLGEISLRLLLDKAFKTHNLNSVWGESFDDNPATKMFKKVGFEFEGVRREFYYRDGKYINASLWSILKSEYI